MANAYHWLATVNWRDFSPAAVKGIIALAKQLAPAEPGAEENPLKYCQIAVSEKKAPDSKTIRAMTFNGKRWVGHDLERKLKDIKLDGEVKRNDKNRMPLPELLDEPLGWLFCAKRGKICSWDDTD